MDGWADGLHEGCIEDINYVWPHDHQGIGTLETPADEIGVVQFPDLGDGDSVANGSEVVEVDSEDDIAMIAMHD